MRLRTRLKDTVRFHSRAATVVYAVVLLALLVMAHGPESGTYHGIVHSKLFDDASGIFLEAEGESTPRWYWIGPENVAYGHVVLSVASVYQDREINVDLVRGRWSYDEKAGPLTLEGLSSALAGLEDQESALADGPLVPYMLDELTRLRDGTFLRPRHHPYSAQSRFIGSHTHFLVGSRAFLPVALLWMLVWPAYLVVSRPAIRRGWFTPRRVYIAAFGVSILLNCAVLPLMSLRGMPWALRNTLERTYVLGLGFPAWFVLNDTESFLPVDPGASWFFVVVGATGWATLASILAVWAGTVQVNEGQPAPTT